jgi:hypothetical protein
MLKNMGPFLILLLFISCGEKKSIRPGVTSKNDLIEVKGEPLKSEEVPAGEVLSFKDNEKFQITGDKVSAIFRDPAGDEKNLLYWRHSFKDCATTESNLSEEAIPEMELSCHQQGISVIFLKGSGKVLRVGEYENR